MYSKWPVTNSCDMEDMETGSTGGFRQKAQPRVPEPHLPISNTPLFAAQAKYDWIQCILYG